MTEDRPPLLPVSPHLRPQPRRNLLNQMSPALRAKLPPERLEFLQRVPVFARVDRTRHAWGWGYDLIAWVGLEWAEVQPWRGQA